MKENEYHTGDKGLGSGPQRLPRYPWIGKRPFYGWIIVGVGVVTQFFQGIANQGFGTYLSPLQEQFGWSKAVLAWPRSVTQVENSILGPLEGWLVDRFGPRWVVTVGVFIMGLGLILFGLTNSLWMYYLSNIVIALGTGLQGLLIMSVAINHWFRRRRSLAQSLFLLGFSLAGVVGVPLLTLVQTTMGWQTSAIGSGLLIWAAGFPAAQLLRPSPEPYGLQPDGDMLDADITAESVDSSKAEEYDFTLSQAVHTRAFWLLGISWAIGNLGMGAAQVHLFLHLEEGVGLSHITAGLVYSLAGLSNIPSRILGGYFGDRIPKRLLISASMVFMAVSIFMLGISTSLQMALVYAVLYGIGWGVRTPVMNAVQGEYFGRKSQGVIRGWLQLLSLPLTVVGPPLVGYIADIQGTYRSAFVVVSFIMLAGAGFILLAAPPRPPVSQEG